MENTCSQYLFLFLLSLSTSPTPPVGASIDSLRFVNCHRTPKTWWNADDYCKSHHGGNSELADARDALDLVSFSEICGGSNVTCWVGLRLSNYHGWRWRNGQENSLSLSILYYLNTDDYHCGTINQNKLIVQRCGKTFSFLCEHNLVLQEEKTWEEALHHCRALEPDTSDLLSFHDEEELSHVQEEMTRAQTEEVWIGLRWLAGRWLWMDRTASGVISLAECPANGNHCGTLSGGGQQARNCVEKRRFFCRKLPPV